ncbi:hypothetical protein ONE63_003852 [Megalurothrips usitatus]|uniref:Uncharacterized protein n=1 Tax=Megalurothrips usitatus TaxID=439358 RepID=A0AAV7X7S4_9NEOP|nr:hypothetical protein ONE63_003852 [Megalurothrips usitatus]
MEEKLGQGQRWTPPALKRKGSAASKKKTSGEGPAAGGSGSAKKARRDARPSLHDEFDDIIKSAKSSVGGAPPDNPVSKGKTKACAPSTYAPKPQPPQSPSKELRVKLVDFQTIPSPVRQSQGLGTHAIDAPSPIMPPAPWVAGIARDGAETAPPSPQGVCLPVPSQSSPSQAAQVVIKEEPQDEDTFVDASDSSFMESGQGLDLDNLIEDIFVNIDVDQNQDSAPATASVEETVSSPNPAEVAAEVLSSSTISRPIIILNSQEKLASSNNSVSAPPVTILLPVQDSDAASSGETPGVDEDAGVPFVVEAVDRLTPPPAVLSTSESNGECEVAEHASKDEAFNEDLNLSNSQFLEIDEKCKEIPSIPASERKEPSILQKIVPGSSRDFVLSPKRPPAVELVVPPAPSMDWIQKAKESHQRLRTLIQHISRLNAMVIRARRAMWPRKESTQQQVHPDNHQDRPKLLKIEPSQHVMPTSSQDPDWNFT